MRHTWVQGRANRTAFPTETARHPAPATPIVRNPTPSSAAAPAARINVVNSRVTWVVAAVVVALLLMV